MENPRNNQNQYEQSNSLFFKLPMELRTEVYKLLATPFFRHREGRHDFAVLLNHTVADYNAAVKNAQGPREKMKEQVDSPEHEKLFITSMAGILLDKESRWQYTRRPHEPRPDVPERKRPTPDLRFLISCRKIYNEARVMVCAVYEQHLWWDSLPRTITNRHAVFPTPASALKFWRREQSSTRSNMYTTRLEPLPPIIKTADIILPNLRVSGLPRWSMWAKNLDLALRAAWEASVGLPFKNKGIDYREHVEHLHLSFDYVTSSRFADGVLDRPYLNPWAGDFRERVLSTPTPHGWYRRMIEVMKATALFNTDIEPDDDSTRTKVLLATAPTLCQRPRERFHMTGHLQDRLSMLESQYGSLWLSSYQSYVMIDTPYPALPSIDTPLGQRPSWMPPLIFHENAWGRVFVNTPRIRSLRIDIDVPDVRYNEGKELVSWIVRTWRFPLNPGDSANAYHYLGTSWEAVERYSWTGTRMQMSCIRQCGNTNCHATAQDRAVGDCREHVEVARRFCMGIGPKMYTWRILWTRKRHTGPEVFPYGGWIKPADMDRHVVKEAFARSSLVGGTPKKGA